LGTFPKISENSCNFPGISAESQPEIHGPGLGSIWAAGSSCGTRAYAGRRRPAMALLPMRLNPASRTRRSLTMVAATFRLLLLPRSSATHAAFLVGGRAQRRKAGSAGSAHPADHGPQRSSVSDLQPLNKAVNLRQRIYTYEVCVQLL
jgi:hypothetical protein